MLLQEQQQKILEERWWGSTVNSNEEIHCMKIWVNNVLSMQVHSVFFNVNDYTHLTVINAAYKQIATNGVTVSSDVNGCYVKKYMEVIKRKESEAI